MDIICSDLEGVFTPEIWINVAKKTGIEELKLTTRDEPDYDKLMKGRLKILDENNLKIKDITDVIEKLDPLEGAIDFVDWMRSKTQLIIVSDTFEQFAGPLMKKLGMPTLFCHTLTIESDGSISDYNLRQDAAKKQTVLALKSLKYYVIAFGDSYNDIAMLKEADQSFLFKPPENVINEFPEFPVTDNYSDLKDLIRKAFNRVPIEKN